MRTPSFKRHRAGDLERHFRRVNLVERAIVQRDLEVDHREAGQHARLHGLFDALLDRPDILTRNRAADDPVHELEALAALQRLELQLDMAVLALAAGLPHELAVDIGPAR